MEQVLYKVHVRLLTTTNRYLNYRARRTIEAATLMGAIMMTCMLVILHRTFVSHSSVVDTNCILKLLQNTALFNTSSSTIDVPNLTKKFDLVAIVIADPSDIHYPRSQIDAMLTSNTSFWDKFSPTFVPLQDHCATQNNSLPRTCDANYLYPSRDSIGGIRQYSASSKDLNMRFGSYRYLFALQRGTLMLTQEREPPYDKNFTVLDVTITPDMSCLSQKKVSTTLARWTTSFDVVVMNWAISAFSGSGYLFNTATRELFNLNYAADFVAKKGTDMTDMGRRESYTNKANYLIAAWRWLKKNLFSPVLTMISARLAESIEATGIWIQLEELLSSVVGDPTALFASRFTLMQAEVDWYALIKTLYHYSAFRIGVLFSTSFLFFISTTLINYILRETQERMLRFTFLLQYHITHRMPFTLLVATHVIGSLVFVPILMGIYFFLFEFFSDQLLAFLVLLVVWMGEVFSVLSLRSDTNIKYFPRIFACYFFLFHVYFFSFPFGFCYLALSATSCYVIHAMIHFWNFCEVPAFESGRISPVRPRMSSNNAPNNNTNNNNLATSNNSSVHARSTNNGGNNNLSNTNSLATNTVLNSGFGHLNHTNNNTNSSNPNMGERRRSNSAAASSSLFSRANTHTNTAANAASTNGSNNNSNNNSSSSHNVLSTHALQQALLITQQQVAQQHRHTPPRPTHQQQQQHAHAHASSHSHMKTTTNSNAGAGTAASSRPRSLTDPFLEEKNITAAATHALSSMWNHLNPSKFLNHSSSSSNSAPQQGRMASDESDEGLAAFQQQRRLNSDAYLDEIVPDTELSAAARITDDHVAFRTHTAVKTGSNYNNNGNNNSNNANRDFFGFTTRPRKNSGASNNHDAKTTDHGTTANSNNSATVKEFAESKAASNTNTNARFNRYHGTNHANNSANMMLRDRAISNASKTNAADNATNTNNSNNKVSKFAMTANIYETVDARRRRLATANAKAQINTEDNPDSVSDITSTNKNNNRNDDNIDDYNEVEKDEEDEMMAGNFYDDDDATTVTTKNDNNSSSNNGSAKQQIFAFPSMSTNTSSSSSSSNNSMNIDSNSNSNRNRSKSSSEVPMKSANNAAKFNNNSNNNSKPKFSIFGNDFNDDEY